MVDVATCIRDCCIQVTSRWLREDPADSLRVRATQDLQDIDSCDVLIRFTDLPPVAMLDGVSVAPRHLITGARMVEMGYALAKGKIVLVVGGRQPIFDHLPQVHHVHDVSAMIEWLRDQMHELAVLEAIKGATHGN